MKFPSIFPILLLAATSAFSAEVTKASKLIIPKIELRQATVDEALGFVRKKSGEVDPDHSGVPIILAGSGPEKNTKVDLSLANVSVGDAVKDLAIAAGLEVTNYGPALVVHSAGAVIPAYTPAANTRASKIILPRLEFRQATITEGADFLRKKCSEMEDSQPAIVPLTIIVAASEKTKSARADLSLTNVSLADAAKYLAIATGLEVTNYGEAIIFHDPGVVIPTDAAPDTSRAAKIIIPKLAFRDATITEAVDFLRKKSVDLDPDKSGVPATIIVVASEKTKNAKVTLSLTNVSLSNAVKYVAIAAGLEATKNGEAFVIKSR